MAVDHPCMIPASQALPKAGNKSLKEGIMATQKFLQICSLLFIGGCCTTAGAPLNQALFEQQLRGHPYIHPPQVYSLVHISMACLSLSPQKPYCRNAPDNGAPQ